MNKEKEQIKSGSIIFECGNPAEELIRLSKGKFFWKGKEVKDINKIYERFNEWLKKVS